MKSKLLSFCVLALATFIMPLTAFADSENKVLSVDVKSEDISPSEFCVNDIVLLNDYLLGCSNETLPESYDICKDGIINAFDLAAMRRIVSENNYINNITACGDGWYIKDATLYISKIYYNVLNTTQLDRYVYHTPWENYDDQFTSAIIDGKMIYRSTGKSDSVNPDAENTGNYEGLFVNNDNLESITFKHLDLDMIKSLAEWFGSCESLRTVDLSGIDTSNVLYYDRMFESCTSLTAIDLNCIDTSAALTMGRMFANCVSLSDVKASECNVDAVYEFDHMFTNCTSLVNVNLSGWHIRNDNVGAMFADCESLKSVDIGTFVFNGDSNTPNAYCFGMFNANNSITSYKFASHWSIDYETFAPPLCVDDNYYGGYIFLGNNQIMYEVITYKQQVPKWYQKYNEDVFYEVIGDIIQDSEYVDIYLSIPDNYTSEPDINDTLGNIADLIFENLDIEDDSEIAMIKDAIDEAKASEEWANLVLSEIGNLAVS